MISHVKFYTTFTSRDLHRASAEAFTIRKANPNLLITMKRQGGQWQVSWGMR